MAFSHRLAFALVLVAFACLFSEGQSTDVCTFGGQTYNAGQSFITGDCSASCKCHSGGGFSCVSLCPPSQVACQDGQTVKYNKEPVANSDCFCDIPYCA